MPIHFNLHRRLSWLVALLLAIIHIEISMVKKVVDVEEIPYIMEEEELAYFAFMIIQ